MLEVPCCVKVTHFYLIIIQYQLQNNHLSNFRDLFDSSLYMFNTFQKSSKYYSQVKGYDAALLFNFFFQGFPLNLPCSQMIFDTEQLLLTNMLGCASSFWQLHEMHYLNIGTAS